MKQRYTLLLLTILSIFNFQIAGIFDQNKMLCITIPKTGTHMLKKTINLITNRSFNWHHWIKDPYTIRQYRKFKHGLRGNGMQTHAWYNKALAEHLEKNNVRCIFTYRDPRDQVVSHAFHILKVHKKWLSHAPGIDLDGVLMELIKRGKSGAWSKLPKPGPMEFQAFRWPYVSLTKEYKNHYLPWLKHKNIYGVRFEELVGPNGGGSRDQQIKQIMNIARHLGARINVQQAHKVADNMWGGTSTFREGQIGGWRNYLKPEHIEELKKDQEFCQLLVDLGYENDFDW